MREIKFDLLYKHSDGSFSHYVQTLEELMSDTSEWGAIYQSKRLGKTGAELIAKRLYSELKDKNNKEIYEGDIIKDRFGILFGVVKYGTYKLSQFTKFDNQVHHIGFYVEKDKFSIKSLEEMCWYIDGVGNPIRTNNIEVVGNTFENKELLNG